MAYVATTRFTLYRQWYEEGDDLSGLSQADLDRLEAQGKARDEGGPAAAQRAAAVNQTTASPQQSSASGQANPVFEADEAGSAYEGSDPNPQPRRESDGPFEDQI